MIHTLRPANDQGVGMVTAVIVAFIVFSLGAVWYSVSVHELDETTFDRHRTSALHIADAGVRQAMYELSETTLNNDPFWAGNGLDGLGDCDVVAVTTEVEGTPEQLGQYWVEVTDATPAVATDYRYMIESWGWSRSTESRQRTVRKIEQEVEIAVERGFVYAIFADTGGLVAGNKKTIYGDVYSGYDIVLSNSTDILPNDAGYPGTGDLTTAGTLEIDNGSNVLIRGNVRAQDGITDNATGTEYWGDVGVPGGGAFFKKATVSGKVSLAGPLDPTSDVTAGAGVAADLGFASLEAVAPDSLPTFSWTDLMLALGGAPSAPDSGIGPYYYWTTWAEFKSWYQANRNNVEGWHYVADTGSHTWKMSQGGSTRFSDDFLVAFEGELTVEGSSSVNPAEAPVTVSLIGTLSSSELRFGKNMTSDDSHRWLLYSAGKVGAVNLATVYGVVYGDEDISTNHLEVHYRPPNADLGFTFATNLRVMPRPFVWREVPDDPLPCPLP